ncbi:MAG TPA: DUF92 domain-containing protein [Anaerolineales bacterium]
MTGLSLLQLGWAVLLALAVGFLARLAGALTTGGAVAAGLVGGAVFGAGGSTPAAALLAFFLSSSLLSHVGRRRKLALAGRFSKGSSRDAGQVLANGGLAALLSLARAVWPGQAWLVAAVGALAAANADTWATELGVLARQQPRLITSGRAVERGTSGAVTALGLGASLAGAGLVALVAVLLGAGPRSGWAILGAGLGGALIDSLLGATLQAGYYCPICRQETEQHLLHRCGNATVQVSGLRGLGNDHVNFISSAAGALLGAGLWSVG